MSYHDSDSEEPERESTNSFKISMFIDDHPDQAGNQRFISRDYHFNNLAWRLHILPAYMSFLERVSFPHACPSWNVFLECDAEGKSELWQARTNILATHWFSRRVSSSIMNEHRFASWNDRKFDVTRGVRIIHGAGEVVVEITVLSQSFFPRPILDAESSIHDVILVLEGQKIPVNKQLLSDQSSYFNGLFYGDFKESKQEEIEIKDTDPEDFREILKMMYGVSTEPITVESATRFLIMGDLFDIKLVKDRMVNFLLSTDLISIHRKLLFAEEYRLEFLKDEVLYLYKANKENLLALKESPEFAELSDSMKDILFENARDLLD